MEGGATTLFHSTMFHFLYGKLFNSLGRQRDSHNESAPFQEPFPSNTPTGQKRWHLLIALILIPVLAGCVRDLTGGSRGWSALVERDGVVYAGTIEGQLLALDKESGQTLWSYPKNGDIGIGGVFNPPAVGEELVYVGSHDGAIYALRSGDSSGVGELVWEGITEGHIVGGPVLAKNKVLVGSEDGLLYAFDASSGELLWTFTTEGKIWSTPAVDERRVYFGSMDRYVYALSLSDGGLAWEYQTGGAVASKPLLVGGKVIVGSFDRTLYALDVGSGEPIWTFDADNWFWGGAVANETTIFAPSMDGKIYALNPKTGDMMWLFDSESPIVSTPLLLEDGLAVASEGGLLHLIHPRARDQQEVWFYDVGAAVRAPISGGGRAVYIGDMDGGVRRINTTGGKREEWRISTAR